MDDNDDDELLETIIISFVNDDKWRVMFKQLSAVHWFILVLYFMGFKNTGHKKKAVMISVLLKFLLQPERLDILNRSRPNEIGPILRQQQRHDVWFCFPLQRDFQRQALF